MSENLLLVAHADSFTAKRMRKLTQRRAVDYTSTVVRYMQVHFLHSFIWVVQFSDDIVYMQLVWMSFVCTHFVLLIFFFLCLRL